MATKTIVAMGGGGFTHDPDNLMLDRFILSRARNEEPKVCFVPTASGDNDEYIADFYKAFATLDCEATHLSLFWREIDDLASFLLAQDIIYVGGGNTANLLAVWRTHGVDELVKQAWEEGVVLCGMSAGMNCWFEGCVTDSFNLNRMAPLPDGLGLLSGSCCPHYDSEEQRRGVYHDCIQRGVLTDGFAADDDAGLVFEGTEMTSVVTSRPDARAFRVAMSAGSVQEEPLETHYLG